MKLREWWVLAAFLVPKLWRAKGYFLEFTAYHPKDAGKELWHNYQWRVFPIRDLIPSHQQTFGLVMKDLEHRPTAQAAPPSTQPTPGAGAGGASGPDAPPAGGA